MIDRVLENIKQLLQLPRVTVGRSLGEEILDCSVHIVSRLWRKIPDQLHKLFLKIILIGLDQLWPVREETVESNLDCLQVENI